ncbi:MAG: hypothetical protein LKH78_10330 [Weizmannia coagulans]|uniref:Uncharacterized protein n=1 Tax=Heyndrickxia faecalis TaxID=2824910 RepID=A0AAU7WC88_9BACI|nr:hypothetical protein P421_05650 [Heyndrickxia coagulans P38]MCI1576096.1 hypothetical protein [Heyndrickxia coagulans]
MDSITAIFIVVSVIILISYYIPRLSFNTKYDGFKLYLNRGLIGVPSAFLLASIIFLLIGAIF